MQQTNANVVRMTGNLFPRCLLLCANDNMDAFVGPEFVTDLDKCRPFSLRPCMSEVLLL